MFLSVACTLFDFDRDYHDERLILEVLLQFEPSIYQQIWKAGCWFILSVSLKNIILLIGDVGVSLCTHSLECEMEYSWI